MSDVVVDSSVVTKWVLPESDSAQAHRLMAETIRNGKRLVVLDLVFPEVTNAIWKHHHRKLITLDQARQYLADLFACPTHVEAARSLMPFALEIAATHGRAVYDAAFVALAQALALPGVTADEPLYNSVHSTFPQIVLLRDW